MIVWESKGEAAEPPTNQLWQITCDGHIQSCLNGLVLDIPNASKEANSQLIMWPADKNESAHQRWNCLMGAGPHAEISGPIVSRLHGLCMAVAADRETGEVNRGGGGGAFAFHGANAGRLGEPKPKPKLVCP